MIADLFSTFNPMIKLHYELVRDLGCINKTQAQLLSVPWPLVKGWKKDLIDTLVSESTWTQVLAMKGLSPGKRKLVNQGQIFTNIT